MKEVQEKINTLLNRNESVWQKFHKSTKVKKVLPLYNPEKWPVEWKTIYFKAYARFEEFPFPEPATPKIALASALKKRQSKRSFSSKKIPLKALSSLFYYSAGLKHINSSSQSSNRFHPSGGGRYPLEVYFLSFKTTLSQGLYHYYPKNHSMEKLAEFDSFKFNRYFTYPWTSQAAGIILISGVLPRTVIKYGNRGYKFTLIEAGHLMQNFYLNAAALNINLCAMAGFADDALNSLLDIDGVNETLIYTAAIGLDNI